MNSEAAFMHYCVLRQNFGEAQGHNMQLISQQSSHMSHRGGQLTSQCFSPSSLQSKPATAIGGWDLIFILASNKVLAAHRSLNLYTGRMALLRIWDLHQNLIFLAYVILFCSVLYSNTDIHQQNRLSDITLLPTGPPKPKPEWENLQNTHRSLAVDELRDMVLGDRSKSESER